MPKVIRVLMLVVIAGAWCMVLHADPATDAASPVTLQIQNDKVVASGLTPRGTVIWFGVGRQREGWSTHVYHWLTTDALTDAAGEATFALKTEVPVKSIWVAVDFATGAYAASSPPAYRWEARSPFPSTGVAYAPGKAGVAAIADSHNDLEVVVVRPGVGVWSLQTSHDAPENARGVGVVIDFANLLPLAASPKAPAPLLPGDLIVAIDPEQMQYFAQQLGPQH